MPTSRPHSRSILISAAGCLLAASMSVAVAADGGTTVRIRPGQWETSTRIWLDGKPVLQDLESASERATREVLERARAQMTAEERAEFDRTLPPRKSIERDTECWTPEEARIDTRTALQESLRSLHSPPWSCRFSGEQANARGYSFEYTCSTSGGGRAEGNARATVNGTAAYTVAIEGRSHAVDNATGRPLEPRMMATRLVSDGVWKSDQCTPEDAADDAEDAGDAAQ